MQKAIQRTRNEAYHSLIYTVEETLEGDNNQKENTAENSELVDSEDDWDKISFT